MAGAAKIVAFDKGVHLRGTTLWFDAERSREMSVLTGVRDKLPPVHRRVIASVQLARALDRAGYDTTVLPAAFGRWVGLSGQEVKLLEVEAPLGAAAALVQSGKERVLVTGRARQVPFEVPHADAVVALAPALGHEGTSLGAVRTALRKHITAALAEGEPVAVFVDDAEVGALLRNLLGGADGLPLVAIGLLARLVGEREDTRRPKVTIGLPSAVGGKKQVVLVDTGQGGRHKGRKSPDLVLPLRWLAGVDTLVGLVDRARAESLYVGGATREQMTRLRERLGSRVELFNLTAPRQLALVEAAARQ